MVEELRNRTPLNGLRVLDLADDRLGMAGRYLADLGADVVRAVPRGLASFASSTSEYTAITHHANKRGVLVDLTSESGREDFRSLIAGADILPGHKVPSITIDR